MNKREHKPSQTALTFFYWYCHPDLREEIEGDLMERFNIYSLKYGYNKAKNFFMTKDKAKVNTRKEQVNKYI